MMAIFLEFRRHTQNATIFLFAFCSNRMNIYEKQRSLFLFFFFYSAQLRYLAYTKFDTIPVSREKVLDYTNEQENDTHHVTLSMKLYSGRF